MLIYITELQQVPLNIWVDGELVINSLLSNEIIKIKDGRHIWLLIAAKKIAWIGTVIWARLGFTRKYLQRGIDRLITPVDMVTWLHFAAKSM